MFRPHFVRAKSPQEFVDAIENYDDGKYTVRFNGITRYDNVLRLMPMAYTDKGTGRIYYHEEYAPVLTVMNPKTQKPCYDPNIKEVIKELDRTHIRHLRSIKHKMNEIEEHNRLIQEKTQKAIDDPYKKQGALNTMKMMDRASMVVEKKPWENEQ